MCNYYFNSFKMNSNGYSNNYSNNKNDNSDEPKTKSKKTKDVLNSIDECTHLIDKIKSLILLFEEKNNKKECPKKKVQNELNKESNFTKQIELTKSKKALTSQSELNQYYQNTNGKVITTFPSSKEPSDSTATSTDTTTPPPTVHLFSKNIPQISTLLERVNSELQVQKFYYGESIRKENDMGSAYLSEINENNKYIELLRRMINEVENKIERLSDKDTHKEIQSIKEKCDAEFHNFEQNKLNEITVAMANMNREDNRTLNEFANDSDDSLTKLSEKIRNLQVHSKSNQIGKSVLDMFHSNILLAHQNNDLVYFILNKLVTPVYQQTLNKVASFPNPPGFNDKRKMIELLKNSISESINKENKREMITPTFDHHNKSEVSIVEELDSDDNYN